MAFVLAVTGCSSDTGDRAGDPDGSTSPTADRSVENLHTDEDYSVAGAGTNAKAAAAETVKRWARPGMDYDTWWAELSPLLSASGRAAYAYTDPEVLPSLKVRSTTVLRDDGYFARVKVVTTLGPIVVTLTKPSSRSGWLVNRFDLAALREE